MSGRGRSCFVRLRRTRSRSRLSRSSRLAARTTGSTLCFSRMDVSLLPEVQGVYVCRYNLATMCRYCGREGQVRGRCSAARGGYFEQPDVLHRQAAPQLLGCVYTQQRGAYAILADVLTTMLTFLLQSGIGTGGKPKEYVVGLLSMRTDTDARIAPCLACIATGPNFEACTTASRRSPAQRASRLVTSATTLS